MKRFLSFLAVVAIIVVCLGFYRGWFTVSGGREAEGNKVDVNLTLDRDKVNRDVETVKEKATELTGQADRDEDLGKSSGDDTTPKQD